MSAKADKHLKAVDHWVSVAHYHSEAIHFCELQMKAYGAWHPLHLCYWLRRSLHRMWHRDAVDQAAEWHRAWRQRPLR